MRNVLKGENSPGSLVRLAWRQIKGVDVQQAAPKSIAHARKNFRTCGAQAFLGGFREGLHVFVRLLAQLRYRSQQPGIRSGLKSSLVILDGFVVQARDALDQFMMLHLGFLPQFFPGGSQLRKQLLAGAAELVLYLQLQSRAELRRQLLGIAFRFLEGLRRVPSKLRSDLAGETGGMLAKLRQSRLRIVPRL